MVAPAFASSLFTETEPCSVSAVFILYFFSWLDPSDDWDHPSDDELSSDDELPVDDASPAAGVTVDVPVAGDELPSAGVFPAAWGAGATGVWLLPPPVLLLLLPPPDQTLDLL